jgi:redox-sensitive bicupin YhaK (pirin superfamily)
VIKVIDIESKAKTPVAEGRVRNILGPSHEGTRVQVAIEEVDAGKTCRLSASDKTQVAYILEGKDAKVAYTAAGKTADHTAQRRAGVYLEPGESATITASGSPLTLLLVTVPKHTAKPSRGAVTDRLATFSRRRGSDR